MRVDCTSKLERLGVREVDISGRDRKDDTAVDGSYTRDPVRTKGRTHQLGFEM